MLKRDREHAGRVNGSSLYYVRCKTKTVRNRREHSIEDTDWCIRWRNPRVESNFGEPVHCNKSLSIDCWSRRFCVLAVELSGFPVHTVIHCFSEFWKLPISSCFPFLNAYGYRSWIWFISCSSMNLVYEVVLTLNQLHFYFIHGINFIFYFIRD